MHRNLLALTTTSVLALAAAAAAEQTALVLYESKGAQAIRQEGIAFVELDPAAPHYGRILAQIPLPPDLVSHHIFYITNMIEGRLWIAEWQPEAEEFAFRGDFDFAAIGQGMALEVYFNAEGDRAYVTTALPGHLNAFDISEPRAPEHLYAVEAAGGAHHMVFSPDASRAYVQNSLINIPGMNDGSISVIDLHAGEKLGSIDTFKDSGLTINTIVLTPEAEDFHAH